MALITTQLLVPSPAKIPTFNGGFDAGELGKPTAEVLAEAVGTPAPIPPAEKPGVWQRLASVFTRKKADARAEYLKLLRRVEIDGKQLSDNEVVRLSDAMDKAGIGEDDAAEHRRLIGKFLAAKEGAAKLPAAQKTLAKVQESITAMEDEATAFRQRWANLETVRQQASGEYAAAAAADLNLAGLQAEVTALFGEN